MNERQPAVGHRTRPGRRAERATRFAAAIVIALLVLGLCPAYGQKAANEPETGTTHERQVADPPDGEVVVQFLNVGQADATLIQAPDATVLIDAGDWRRNDVVPHLERADVESIDLVILTHPHADHIGQVPQVLDAFEVTEVWMSGWEHDTQTFERTLDAVLASDAGYHEPRAGEGVVFGDLRIEVINPVEPLEDVHDNLAVRVVFGDFAAIYTGDAEAEHEAEMIDRLGVLPARVLQLGHHGSRTSSSAAFLAGVDPELAIYSARADNRYGHPHDAVIERLADRDVDVYGTDVHGTIRVITDGTGYRVETDGDGAVRSSRGDRRDAPAAGADCVDLNTASLEQLERIVHIGPTRAERIVELRPFERMDQLERVRGIGASRLDDIKSQGLACVK